MREMKDSGIEWIGEIPIDWEIRRIKYVSQLYTGNSIKDEEKSKYVFKECSIPYIATKDICVDTSIANYSNGMYVNVNDTNFKKADKFSTILCIEGGSAGKKITFLTQKIAFVNKLCCFNPVQINARLLYYYLKSPSFTEEFTNNISGMIGGVSIRKLNNLSIVFPPLPIQQHIADYLDKHCAKIDTVIEKTKTTIAEYKKLKQSIITEAVTKGLNPNVEMKGSGIEWIGEIPIDWGKSNPFRICKIIRGNSPFKKDDLKNTGEFVALQYGKTYKVDEINEDFTFYVDKSFYKEEQVISKGNTIFITTSETLEDLGHSCFYNRDDKGLLGGEQVSLFPKNQHYKFIYYASTYFNIEINQYATGLKVFRVKSSDFKKINIVIPPTIREQKEIALYLDEKCSTINNIITKKQTIITELESYKKSLIYECVTGKREVI